MKKETGIEGVSSSSSSFEDIVVIGGLVGVQVVTAINVVFLTTILALGIDPLFLVSCGNAASGLFLLPFAVAVERKKWPGKLRVSLLLQFIAIAFGGTTVFQALMLMGIKKTSPAIASAMPNMLPCFIFIIAACTRFEKVDLKCNYSRAKILGTLVCLSGAISISFSQSPKESPVIISESPTGYNRSIGIDIEYEWIIGCLYMLASIIIISFTTVLQAVTLREFPAPFSLCVITAFLGSILTAVLQIISEGKMNVGSTAVDLITLASFIFLGGCFSSVCVTFQTWSISKKGPVFVSMFSPIQTVCSAILSAIILQQFLSLGSWTGMFLMFAGLYMVLWAKKKEARIAEEADEEKGIPDNMEKGIPHDFEKPLLS